jgi:urea transporter
MSANYNLALNTLAGTLLACVGIGDLEKSAVLAAVGAAVSFSISLLLRCLWQKLKKWFRL